MLVVLGIVVTLATITSVIAIRQTEKGRLTDSKAMAGDLAMASELWFNNENYYPYDSLGGTAGAPMVDTAYSSGDKATSSELISNLAGVDVSLNSKNYLADFKDVNAEGVGGLIKVAGSDYDAITDKWGNTFVIIYDHSGDGKVEAGTDAILGEYKGEIWSSASIVILSGGKDGVLDKKDDVFYKK